jgi:carboxylate-amine ligase
LSGHTAVALAAYVQALAAWLIDAPPESDPAALARVYTYNRFQACRFGLYATLIDPEQGGPIDLQADLLATLERIQLYVDKLGARREIGLIYEAGLERRNDAARIRAEYERRGALADVVRWQCDQWGSWSS